MSIPQGYATPETIPPNLLAPAAATAPGEIKIGIRIREFFQRPVYKRDAKGRKTHEFTMRDMVRYSPIGNDKVEIEAFIDQLNRFPPLDDEDQTSNSAILMAMERWRQIEPYYNAWKKGEEVPDNGVPLGVVTFISKEIAQVLKMRGITTLEKLLEIPDGAVDRLGVPGVRGLMRQAKAFLDARDANRAVAMQEEQQNEIEALKQALAENQAQTQALMARLSAAPAGPVTPVAAVSADPTSPVAGIDPTDPDIVPAGTIDRSADGYYSSEDGEEAIRPPRRRR